jgi:hypothetical protein
MNEKDCTQCVFAVRDQIVDPQNKPVVGQYQFTCKRVPPSVFPIPGGQGQFKLASAFPVVALGMYCAMYETEN